MPPQESATTNYYASTFPLHSRPRTSSGRRRRTRWCPLLTEAIVLRIASITIPIHACLRFLIPFIESTHLRFRNRSNSCRHLPDEHSKMNLLCPSTHHAPPYIHPTHPVPRSSSNSHKAGGYRSFSVVIPALKRSETNPRMILIAWFSSLTERTSRRQAYIKTNHVTVDAVPRHAAA